MQRHSGGFKVPMTRIEKFASKTTDVAGTFVCVLKYPPKSVDHILIESMWAADYSACYFATIASLVGKELSITVYDSSYANVDYKALAPVTVTYLLA